jgi:16S rRNA (guanine527-N7)-methyltransferase
MKRRDGRVSTQAGEGPDDRALLPAVPAIDATSLIDDARRIGLSFDRPAAEKLLAYLGLLQRWNGTYNLTAVREPAAMYVHHLLDCLAVLPPLRRVLGDRSARIADVGSGAGLPGVVIAVLCPHLNVTCIDTVGKKVAFVRQVGAELCLRNLRAEQGRVERLQPVVPFDLITSRAFAPLLDFVQLTRPLLAPHGIWMAMKGKVPEDEIAALPPSVEVFHVEQLHVPELQADRCLVWMRPRAGEGDPDVRHR